MRRSAKIDTLINRIERFRKDEGGGMLVLMLAVFFGITIFGGLAVDLANHERTRTTFQTHLDNAVLAAASLSQDLDPEEVVRSYLTSAGLDASEVLIETSEEKIGGILVGRTVEASLPAGLNTYFFRFLRHRHAWHDDQFRSDGAGGGYRNFARARRLGLNWGRSPATVAGSS